MSLLKKLLNGRVLGMGLLVGATILISNVGVGGSKANFISKERIVKVDTGRLIRETSEDLAKDFLAAEQRREGGSPKMTPALMAKKLESYKENLVESLNAYGNKNQCIILTSAQAYGDVFDVTDDFVAFINEDKGQ